MTYINITNDDSEEFDMYEEDEQLDLSPWFILNTQEIGAHIAYQLFDVEYDIREEDIDVEINDYLSHIHQKIRDKAINILSQNNREVL